MPIPIYKSQVKEIPLPGVRQSVRVDQRAFDPGYAQLAQAAGAVGDQVTHFALAIKDREDTARVKDAYTKASDEARKLMFENIYKRKGLKAISAAKDTEEGLSKIKGKYTEGLSRAQKRKFDRFWGSLRNTHMGGAARHQLAQMSAAESEKDDAIIEGAFKDGNSMYNDPKTTKHSLEVIHSTLKSKATREGWPAEVLKNKQAEAQTKFYAGLVQAAIAQKDHDAAKKILEDHKKEIDPKIHAALKSDLARQVDIVLAQKAADAAMIKYPPGSSTVYKSPADKKEYTGEAAALKWVEDNYEGEQERRMKQEIKVRYSDSRRLTNQKLNEQADDLTKKIQKAKTLTEAMDLANESPSGRLRTQLMNIAITKFPEHNKRVAQQEITKKLVEEDRIRQEIDEGVYSSVEGVQRAADRLTETQRKSLTKYFSHSGNSGELKRLKLESLLKTYGSSLSKNPELWQYTLDRLPPGKEVTDEVLSKIIVPVLTQMGEANTWWGPDINRTYTQALKKGQGDMWLPFLDTGEEDKIRTLLIKKYGMKKPTIKDIKRYKKHNIMGIPIPNSYRR